MIKYVLGFAFSKDLQNVVLIQKQKPTFQHGKLNGVGGKIESDESADDAMVREFTEETGVTVRNWIPFVTLQGVDWECVCYFTILDKYKFESVQTQEREFIVCTSAISLPTSCMRNIHWLIPMALNWDSTLDRIIYSES
jgi:8-oxo-dGTP diphosphatase